MKTHKAIYANESEMAIFTASNDKQAIKKAMQYEGEYGALFNVFQLDDEYNEIKSIY
jgi:hypothetical protein